MKSNLTTLFPACVLDNKGFLYYVTHLEHTIKRLDLKKEKAEYVISPKGFVPTEWGGVDRLIFNNDKIYMFEQKGRWLLEYSLVDQTSRCFDLNCNIHNCANWAACIIYNDVVFAFPCFANKVIKINLLTSSIENEERLCSEINYIFNQETYICNLSEEGIEIPYKLYSCGCQIENKLWLFMEREQFIIKYDLQKEKHTQCSLPKQIVGCIHAVWKEGVSYILSTEDKVYSWNPFNDSLEILFDSKEVSQHPYFGKIVVTDKNIWIMPCFGKDIYIINLEKKKGNIYCEYPEDFNYCEDPYRSKYFDYTEDEKKYYVAMHSANYLLIIEKPNGGGYWLKIKEPDLIERINYYKERHMQQYEDFFWGLNEFMGVVDHNYLLSDKIKNSEVGNIVWRYINKL